MDVESALAALEEVWDVDGFLWVLRDGRFDRQAADEFLRLLKSIELQPEAALPRRFVTLLWYLPSFLEWQKPRVEEREGGLALYSQFVTDVHNCLEELLGVP